eukprot:scaffold181903_cov30-Tisochrysis_lutea.AAC.5
MISKRPAAFPFSSFLPTRTTMPLSSGWLTRSLILARRPVASAKVVCGALARGTGVAMEPDESEVAGARETVAPDTSTEER